MLNIADPNPFLGKDRIRNLEKVGSDQKIQIQNPLKILVESNFSFDMHLLTKVLNVK